MQLTRLRYFVAHVRRTVERMEQAKTGQHRYTLEQLDMLDVREGMFYGLSSTKGTMLCTSTLLPNLKKDLLKVF